MCTTCGCGENQDGTLIRRPGDNSFHVHVGGPHHKHEHGHHDHTHEHGHSHPHDHQHTSNEIKIEEDVLKKNNLLAERNRGFFEAKHITAFNIVSSPGSGKTTLLEKTIHDLKQAHSFYVIEGDQQTMNDSERIQNAGAKVMQVNTGSGCHLDANMVNRAAKELHIDDDSVLFIENVGNLVCPAMFDLGETRRIVMFSVTEGEDKPVKYPLIFQNSAVCIINKIDLLPHLEFDIDKAKTFARQVNPSIEFFELSATKAEGLEAWYQHLKKSF
jgi:hydrogenase nickel incorporation protein HypB